MSRHPQGRNCNDFTAWAWVLLMLPYMAMRMVVDAVSWRVRRPIAPPVVAGSVRMPIGARGQDATCTPEFCDLHRACHEFRSCLTR